MVKLKPNDADVEIFLQNDRQWLRPHRITYAKLRQKQARKAKDDKQADFWRRVIDRNGTLMQHG